MNLKPLKTRQVCLFFIAFAPITKVFTMPGLLAAQAGRDMWLCALIALTLDVITLGVIMIFLRNENTDFYGLLQTNFGKVPSKIILALYAVCFFLKALLPIFEQQDFVTMTFYVTTPKSLMFLPYFIVAAYLVLKPLRVIGRCADVLFIFTAIGLLGLLGLSLTSFDAGALLPLFTNGAKNIFKGAYIITPWFGDCVYYLFMTGRFDRRKKDGLKIFFAYLGAGLAAVLFITVFYGTFSSIAFRQRFAVSEISKYSSVINNIGRLDYLSAFLILFSGVISLTVPLFFAGEILNVIFPQKSTRILPLAVCAAAFTLLLALNERVFGLERFITQYASAFFILTANILPIFICIMAKKRKPAPPLFASIKNKKPSGARAR